MGVMSRITIKAPVKPVDVISTPSNETSLATQSLPLIRPSSPLLRPVVLTAPAKNEKPKSEIAKTQIPVSEKFVGKTPPPKNAHCKKCGCAIFWFPKNPKFENRPYCVECEPPPSPPKLFVRAVAAFSSDGKSEQIFDLPSMGVRPKTDAVGEDLEARLKPLAWSTPDVNGWCWGIDLDGRLHMATQQATRDAMTQRLDESDSEYERRTRLVDEFWRMQIENEKS